MDEYAPLTFMPIAGENANEEEIEAVAATAEAVIFAVDGEGSFGKGVLETFIKPGNSLKRVSVMSRYLSGDGMSPFATAAKFAGNKEVWDGNKGAIDAYRTMEKTIASMAKDVGIDYTIIRAGTLKGGGNGNSGIVEDERAGEKTLLAPDFYKLGVQDIVNWRLLYDCAALGVKLVAGDTLPGPGFTAALTATDKVGDGDSHRGAVAAALVEALRAPAAANRDFSIGAEEGRTFPTEDEWAAMFTKAAA